VRALRWLIGLVVVLALALGIGDVVVRDHVQSAVAARIERQAPGSHATVRISSFPFLGRLAVSGQVLDVDADVTGVTDGHVHFSHVVLHLADLMVSRHAIVKGKLRATSLRSGSVTAEVTQASLRVETGQPVTIGDGTLGLDGHTVPATVKVSGGVVTVEADGAARLSLAVPSLAIVPCLSSARLVPGALELTCRFTGLPAALSGTYSL